MVLKKTDASPLTVRVRYKKPLATMMRAARFEIDPSRVVEPDAFATLRPRGGIAATVHTRRSAN